MIVGTTLILGTAIVGGALANKAVNSFVLGDVERDWLADELEFDSIHPDRKTVSLKNGQVMRIFQLKGQAYETKSFEEEETLLRNRTNVLHQSAKPGVVLRFFGVKRMRDVSFDAHWPTITLEEIGKAEQKQFKSAYSVSWFLVVQAPSQSLLIKTCKNLSGGFGSYGAELVEAADEPDKPCPLSRFINYLLCGELIDELCSPSANLSGNLPASDLHFDGANGTIDSYTPNHRRTRVIGVRLWPEQVSGMLVSRIMSLSGEVEVSQICKVLHNEKSLALLHRQAAEQRSSFFGSAAVLEEIEETSESLTNNAHSLFETQFQIAFRARSDAELEELQDEITDILNKARVTFSLETKGVGVVWFNRMAGHERLLRPLRMFDINIAALWPFQYSPEGKYTSPFGDRPVRLFKTPTGQNYAFQFHIRDKKESAGNYLVFAPTGTGKSTLILHLLSGFAKFPGVRNYIFDSEEGARYMIECMGGVYQGYNELALNPLDMDLSNKDGQHSAHLIMRAMLGEVYSSEMDDHIQAAIDYAGELEPGLRTFNNIYNASFPPRSVIRQEFAKWIHDGRGRDGIYSHIFNSRRDQIAAYLDKSFLVGINMNKALEDVVLGPAIVAHIIQAISRAARSSKDGFTIFVDEAANLLQNAGFRTEVLKMYREYRKRGGLVGLAFQEPGALLNFEDSHGIIHNTQTIFLFPNSKAETEDLKALGLTHEQIDFVKGGLEMRGGRQVLLIKQELASSYNESTILDIDLSGLGDALRFYRAGDNVNAELKLLKEKYGDQWLAQL